MKYLLLILLLTSCFKVKPVDSPRPGVKGLTIITDFCTGPAVYTPEYGVVFKVADVFCQAYDTTNGEFLAEMVGGSIVIMEGDQYMMIPPEQVQKFFEDLGDEGVIEFLAIPN